MSEEKPEEVDPVDEDRAGSDPEVFGEEFNIGWIWEIMYKYHECWCGDDIHLVWHQDMAPFNRGVIERRELQPGKKKRERVYSEEKTKAGIKEKAKSPSSHSTTLTQLKSKFAVGVAGVRSSADRSK